MDCGMIGGELCDRCLEEDDDWNDGKKRRREDDEEEVQELKRLRGLKDRERLLRKFTMEQSQRRTAALEKHEWLQGKCAVCWIHGEMDSEHETKRCMRLRQELGVEYVGFRGKYLGYRNVATCYKCGLPGDECHAYGNRRKCENEDVILPVALMGYLRQRELGLREAIREVTGKEFESVTTYCSWLVEGRRTLGVNGSNAFAVYEMIVSRILGNEDEW
jgi:hypothetical protein